MAGLPQQGRGGVPTLSQEVLYACVEYFLVLFAWNVFGHVFSNAFRMTHLAKNTTIRAGDPFYGFQGLS
jgi:hypothetical protein